MNAWTWAWIGWGLYFAVVEGLALKNRKKGDTLSEHVWAFLGYREGRVGQPTGTERLRRFLTLAGLAWLVVHLLTGGVF
ncbi:hypothetical protein Ait01nite_089290 [Actinoplanes italicus]|uniref:Uncharacterized protein n=1 Tax=Actinoplanes italicus TaxID=113567 RepID=A0A2T0JIB6_9ACTN|nr:hypothetical protein [Actinoplanes italicus]PRX07345.1 hypothetical protein CLV67_14220 [Actinoplanes italicus]GIE35884.1 hypothetical protein Ait01nite_089290 [Actinoplanes italicus]